MPTPVTRSDGSAQSDPGQVVEGAVGEQPSRSAPGSGGTNGDDPVASTASS